MTGAELVDVRQAARELDLEVRTVQRRIADGTIAAEKFGTHPTAPYMITRAELERVKAAAASAAAS